MPLKHNVTKYDVLATRIRKIALKNGTSDLPRDEKRAVIMAILVASFSSGLSWKTHNVLMENLSNMHSEEIKEEYRQAKTSRWKSISSADICEVLNMGVSNAAFSSWLFFNVDNAVHSSYKAAWDELQHEFIEACDDIELAGERVVK